MEPYVNMSQFSESEVKLRSNQTGTQYCGLRGLKPQINFEPFYLQHG